MVSLYVCISTISRNLVANYDVRSQWGRNMGKRRSTKYPGVQARESEERRYRGRSDICYTIDYRDASGKRVRKDVGWASQGFSAALAAEMRAKLVNAAKTASAMGEIPMSQNTPCPTFKEAWERYRRDWLLANGKDVVSPNSLVKLHLSEFLNLPLNEISPYRLDQLMANMRRQGRSAQTIRHAVGLVRRVMKRMARWGLYSGPMPFEAITMPVLNNARERFLTPAEARLLLSELERRSRQTWLMALISLHCGLRFGEIARLRWEDVRHEQMTLYIPESKSGRARHAVMTEEVSSALAALGPGNRSDLVFPSRTGEVMTEISKVFFRAVDEIGLNDGITDRRQKVVFHTLRHTYASWLAKSGQGQLTIADRLGHRSLEMTRRYTHLMDETRKASADAISRMFHDGTPENQQ